MRISDWSSDVCSSDLTLDSSLRRAALYPAELRVPRGYLMRRPRQYCKRAGAQRALPPVYPPVAEGRHPPRASAGERRSEEHTSELQSLMRISYAVFCLKKKKHTHKHSRPKPTTA